MAGGIAIPSPSAILTSSPPPPSSSTSSAPLPLTAAVPETQRPKNIRRPSKDAKKPTPKKDQPVDSSIVKPKQSKSRNGCVTCKAKRLKCGEEKPGCQQCARRNVECGGYKKDFKWRPFEETNVKINIDRQKQTTSPKLPTSATSSKSTTPTLDPPPRCSVALQPCPSSAKVNKDSPASEGDKNLAWRPKPPKPPKPPQLKDNPLRKDSTNRASSDPLPNPSPSRDNRSPPPPRGAPSATFTSQLDLPSYPTSPVPVRGFSPTLTEILRPSSVENAGNNEFVDFAMPDGMQLPFFISNDENPHFPSDGLIDDDVEDLMRHDEAIDGPLMDWTSRFNTPSSSNSSGPEDVIALWQGRTNYMYPQPRFAPDTMEILTQRFDRMTCGILSVIDGPTENPWRSLIWPLAQQSPALYHAVAAMTAFHSSSDIPAFRIIGHEHKSASIRYIQEGIRDNSMSDEMAIATALALGFSESWDQHTSTGNSHIKGAQVLVKRALRRHQINPLQGVQLARLKFLCNAWVYMDVIARLTSVDSDESNDFDNTFLFSADSPQMVMGNGAPGFGIDFGMPIDARLDPLMGCANTLFPLIGRVANLVRKVCRSQTNSPAVISQANDLKTALEAWEPPAFIERPEDPTTLVQHTLQTAEAYRWATLLHLHQSVPEIPSMSSAELAQRVLQYLATVPLESRTVIVQIYPLMVAGCEASDSEDRHWVRQRWAAMGRRLRIGVIDKCTIVTEEVWRRKDAYENQPKQRGRLVATAELQPARQRGVPLNRKPADFRSSDPGRTGMVFSYVENDGGDNEKSGRNSTDNSQPMRPPRMNDSVDRCIGHMNVAYTVRGHLHWVGVMWDWAWEILLG